MLSLNKQSEFKYIYLNGRKVYTPNFYMHIISNYKSKDLTIGIIIKKKFGNAVFRNRLRRLIKQSFRLLESKLKKGLKILVIFRNSSLKDPFKIKLDTFYLELFNILKMFNYIEKQKE